MLNYYFSMIYETFGMKKSFIVRFWTLYFYIYKLKPKLMAHILYVKPKRTVISVMRVYIIYVYLQFVFEY